MWGKIEGKTSIKLNLKVILNLVLVAVPVCFQNPCMNGGTCNEEGIVGFTCECIDGWGGEKCEVEGKENS